MSNIGFSSLPDELVLYVFSSFHFKELLLLSPVCQLWRKLAGDPSLYKKIVLTKEDRRVATRNVLQLISGKRFLQELSIDNRRDSAQVLEFTASNCPNLEKVSIKNGTLTDVALKVLGGNCSCIRELCFVHCDLGGCSLSHLSRLKNVSSIDLTFCDVRDVEEAAKLVKGFPLLKELNIRDVSVEDFLARSHRIIPSNNDALQKLMFSGVELEAGDLQRICFPKKRMLIFGVSHVGVDDENDVLSIFQMHKLVWLRIDFSKISASIWKKVFIHNELRNLRHLDLTGSDKIDNGHMKLIGEAFPLLSYLNISSCDEVSDEGISALLNACSTSLEFLVAADLCYLEGSCLSNIPCKLPQLILLDLSECMSVDSPPVATLVQRMPCLALRWWDRGMKSDRTNARFDKIKDVKELKAHISVKEARAMYGLGEEL